MRFDRIRLENFKCYGDADLSLGPGVTVIHGLNGSGKSSLLEACFFALYGSKALDKTLDDVVTIGADSTEVELWFTHGGTEYHVERRVRATGERASTAKCVLEAPDATIEGARDVRGYVEELLRMDHEAFVNCAYVRQGEVNKLINASPAQRQDMLDSLLQLGKLEEYRERASDARLGVKHVKDDKQGALSQLDDQIAEKEDKDLHERLNGLESDRESVREDIDHIESQREQAVETRDEAAAVLDQYEEKQAELADLESDIEELRGTISETEREREEIDEQIAAAREDRESVVADLESALVESDLDAVDAADVDTDEVERELDELAERDDELQERIEEARLEKNDHENTVENLRERAEDLESEAASNREDADALETEVEEARETLAEKRARIDDLDEEITGLRDEFDDAPVEFGEADSLHESVSDDLSDARERVAQLEADAENQREAIAEAEDLLEAGKCPECGQDVDGAPHVETIDDDRETLAYFEGELEAAREERDRLESRRERAQNLVEIESAVADRENDRERFATILEERESSVEERVEQVDELREEADRLDEQADELREEAAEAEDAAEACRERIATVNQTRSTVKERRQRLERIADHREEFDDLDDEIDRLRERRERLGETNDERRERLAEKRERRNELQETFDEGKIEAAREERERAEAYIGQADEKLAELEERDEQLGQAIGGVENELAELESLRERREGLVRQVDHLESLYDEAEQLQEMYGTLRAQLRQRNVESLEAMLNEIFELVYQNDSYSRIELSGEYELTVYQKDGEPLDPEQLSGGERALFNLSLRCAIYRLLAEGIEGAAPMPPLILDEPTVFLDSGHVSQLVELVEAMRAYGVEQILVVSHDEELVGAADDLVRVRKDSTTNRSTVERTDRKAQLVEEALEAD